MQFKELSDKSAWEHAILYLLKVFWIISVLLFNYGPWGNRLYVVIGGSGANAAIPSYTHNANNELVQSSRGSAEATSYQYDANGNLAKKTEDGATGRQ